MLQKCVNIISIKIMMFTGHFDLSISWLKAASETPNKN